jgi:hypothetical protein
MKRFEELSEFERECIVSKISAEELIKMFKGDNEEIRKSPIYVDIKGELGDIPIVKEPVELRNMRLLKIAYTDVNLKQQLVELASAKAANILFLEENDITMKLPEIMMCLSY